MQRLCQKENSASKEIEISQSKEKLNRFMENNDKDKYSAEYPSPHENVVKETTSKGYDTSFTILINKWSSKEKVRPIMTKNTGFESLHSKDDRTFDTFSRKSFLPYKATQFEGISFSRI